MGANGKSDVVSFTSLHDFFKPKSYVHPPVHTEGPSMTRQEFAEECDINMIMERYERTGELPVNRHEARYIDTTALPTDLRGYLDFMNEAQASFMQLPAKVRKEFDNDPVAFVDFAMDEANLGKLKEWGLAKPDEVVPPPMKVEVVNQPPAQDAPAADPKKGA